MRTREGHGKAQETVARPDTPPSTLQVPREVAGAIVGHALAEHPIEACGIVCGRGGQLQRVVPLRNDLDSETAYAFEPQQQLAVWDELEERGEQLAAVYHSHTDCEAFPSGRDVQGAVYPVPYLIVSTQGAPLLRAFWLADGTVTEQQIIITD